MKLILIPPYQNRIINWGFILREAVGDFRQKGRLEGIEVDVDEGYFIDSDSPKRDEEVLALISVGIIKKVKEYCATGKYDAIVLTGAIDPGFSAARFIAKIPVTTTVHSSLHVASLIGDRCTWIHSGIDSALIVRHLAERYGLGHKLAAVRSSGHTTTEMFKLISQSKDDKAARYKIPAMKKLLDDIMTQCVAAIEKDRADSIILSCEPFLTFEDELRRRLDEAGYDEITLISSVSAGIAMARAMVNMQLLQTARAYPDQNLKAKPEYW